MFLLNPYRFATGGGGFLDNLATSPFAAWSMRRMCSTATNALRLRRSSDNTEQDIGFSGSTVGSGLDTSAISSFVGSNSAYVVTWYDQTGNGKHLTQATASKQPRLVNAGTLQSAVSWDGTDDYMSVSSLTNTNPQCAFYTKQKLTANADKVAIETSTNYNSNAGALLYYANSGGGYDVAMCQSSGSTRDSSFTPGSLGSALNLVTLLWDRTVTGISEVGMRVGGSAQTPSGISTNECTGNFSTYDCYVGARAGSSVFANVEFETLVFYNANTASLASSIEAIIT